MIKWRFNTIEEAKKAMPLWDKILTTSADIYGSERMFAPTSCGTLLNGFAPAHEDGWWLIVETKDVDVPESPQDQAARLIPFVEAFASGEKVSCFLNGKWSDCAGAFVTSTEYRIEPKTILVNGFEVPEPMRVEPAIKSKYYLPALACEQLNHTAWWDANHAERLKRGICHSTKEAAVAHAKAMLGIDPKSNEECNHEN
jgi:hypothetical protein